MLIRAGTLLVVTNRYPNHDELIWNLPGGRQEPGELLEATLTREVNEETGLDISVGPLRYVSESFDRTTATHFTNFTFTIAASGEPRVMASDAHVVAVEWLPIEQIADRFKVRVVREPLLAHLRDESRRYFSFASADISIVFNDG